MSAAKKGRSFTDYLVAKRVVNCPVCKIPDALRAQFALRRSRNLTVADVLEWLRVEHRIRVTAEQYAVHCKAGHEAILGRIRKGKG